LVSVAYVLGTPDFGVPLSPINDCPENATVIPNTGTFQFSNLYAEVFPDVCSTCNYNAGSDVWFTTTFPCNTTGTFVFLVTSFGDTQFFHDASADIGVYDDKMTLIACDCDPVDEFSDGVLDITGSSFIDHYRGLVTIDACELDGLQIYFQILSSNTYEQGENNFTFRLAHFL
jgi:hypothetical protein